jgi:two-component sensor histidine kinase
MLVNLKSIISILVVLILGSSVSFGQGLTDSPQREIDSLELLKLDMKWDDPDYLEVVNNLMRVYDWNHKTEEYDSVLKELEVSLNKNKDPLAFALYNLCSGIQEERLGNLKKAIIQCEKSTSYALKCEDGILKSQIISNCYRLLGDVFLNSGKPEIGRENCKKAIIEAKKYNYFSNIVICNNNIGSSFDEQKQYDSAFVYYHRALEFKVSFPTSFIQAGLANTLRDLCRYEEAFDQLIVAFKPYEADSNFANNIISCYVLTEACTILKASDTLPPRCYEWMEARGGQEYILEHILEASVKASQNSSIFESLLIIRPLLAEEYAKNLNFEKSYEILKDHLELYLTINDEKQQNYIAKLDAQFHKAEDKKAIFALDKKLLISSNQKKSLRLKMSFLIVIIVGVVFFFIRLGRKQRLLKIQKNLITRSLDEKELLLKEVHHRVKNNLQIISSLLNQQALKADNIDLRSLVEDGQRRIKSMAIIHQKLYQSDSFENINMQVYAKELTSSIAKSMATNETDIKVQYSITDFSFNVDTAISIGLVLNELVTNAYKYAFINRKTGTISISIQPKNDELFEIKVVDNGIGLPIDIEERLSKSLGLSLVGGLGQQMRGDFNYYNNDGSTFVLSFNPNAAA